MKKYIVALVALSLVIPQVSAFRDVADHSKIYPAVQALVEKGCLREKGSFFRPEAHVDAKMFWKVVLCDAGFDTNSATFNTPLPANVYEDDPMAQYIREGIRRGFINGEEDFDEERLITRIEAIRVLTKTKAIPVGTRASKAFMYRASGIPGQADYLPTVEAAYASNMLDLVDIKPFRARGLATRRDLVRWIHNFNTKGEKKWTLNSRGQENLSLKQSARKRNRRSTSRKRTSNPKSGNPPIRVEILDGRPSEIRKAGSGLHIPNGALFENVYKEIESKWLAETKRSEDGKFDETLTVELKEKMINAAMAAMVKELDKYSTFVEPGKSKDFKQSLDGQFEGIGAYVEMIDEDFTITAPIKGSPAEEAGIYAGDIVTHVDGESIKGMPIGDIVDLIKGKAGTLVKLSILRDKTKKEFRVTRGKIVIPPITLEWKNSVPVIGIHRFMRGRTKTDLANMINNEVLPKKPRGIVFDLRNNPGGFLTSAVQVGEFFLERNDLIFSVIDKNKKKEYRSSREGELVGYDNIIVLQNKGTASASEIFAGMIQDYGIGKVIGTKSTGKGTVQELTNYSNGSVLKLTIAKWLTPKGRWVQDTGVIPDIEVADPTPEQRRQKIDPQIDRAVREILGG